MKVQEQVITSFTISHIEMKALMILVGRSIPQERKEACRLTQEEADAISVLFNEWFNSPYYKTEDFRRE